MKMASPRRLWRLAIATPFTPRPQISTRIDIAQYLIRWEDACKLDAGQGRSCGPAVTRSRWRLVRPSCLSRRAEIDPPARQQGRRRDPRLREFLAAALRSGKAARRARRLGHARRADLPPSGARNLSERPRLRCRTARSARRVAAI